MMLRILATHICLLCCFHFLHGEMVSDELTKAIEEYQDGNYQAALNIYTHLIEEGYQLSEIYYNQGNCHFKLRNTGPAILAYERAIKIAPRDSDIRYNLDLARSEIREKIAPIEQFFLARWFETIRDSLSSNTWLWLSIIFFWLMLGIVISGIWRLELPGKWMLVILVITSTGFFILTILGVTKQLDSNSSAEAILIQPEIILRVAPDETSASILQIFEGEKVFIMDQIGGWYKVQLENKEEGWLQEDAMEKI